MEIHHKILQLLEYKLIILGARSARPAGAMLIFIRERIPILGTSRQAMHAHTKRVIFYIVGVDASVHPVSYMIAT